MAHYCKREIIAAFQIENTCPKFYLYHSFAITRLKVYFRKKTLQSWELLKNKRTIKKDRAVERLKSYFKIKVDIA